MRSERQTMQSHFQNEGQHDSVRSGLDHLKGYTLRVLHIDPTRELVGAAPAAVAEPLAEVPVPHARAGLLVALPNAVARGILHPQSRVIENEHGLWPVFILWVMSWGVHKKLGGFILLVIVRGVVASV